MGRPEESNVHQHGVNNLESCSIPSNHGKGPHRSTHDNLRQELDSLRAQYLHLKNDHEHVQSALKQSEACLKAHQEKADQARNLPKDGKKANQSEIERVRFELAQALKTNREQTERIQTLKKQSDAVDARLQECRKSTLNDQAEIKTLRQKLRLADAERDKLAKRQGDAGDMRKKVLAAEDKRKEDVQERNKQLIDLQKQLTMEKRKAASAGTRLAELQTKFSRDVEESRTTRHGLDKRVVENQAQANDALANCIALEQEVLATKEACLERVELISSTLKQMAEEYGRLASSTVSKSAHSELNLECFALRMRVARLERKLANSEDRASELVHLIRHYKENCDLLVIALEDSEAYAKIVSDTTCPDDIDHHASAEVDSMIETIQEFEAEKRTSDRILAKIMLERFRGLAKLGNLRYEELLASCLDAEQDLTEDRERTESLTIQVTGLEEALSTEKKEHLALVVAKQSLDYRWVEQNQDLMDCRAQLQLYKDKVLATEASLNSIINHKDAMLKREREAAQRLSSTIQQQHGAEAALQADIEQLSAELAETGQFREAYEALLQEVQGLAARNELAEDEADRLSKMNAEILGHNNPTQRILYVDKIRRELAETKQKLLVIVRERETALGENNVLQDELDMYKSVAVPFGERPRTAMTRIARVPLAPRSQNAELQRGQNNLLDASLPNISVDMTW